MLAVAGRHIHNMAAFNGESEGWQISRSRGLRYHAHLGEGPSADQHGLSGGVSGKSHPAAIRAVLNQQALPREPADHVCVPFLACGAAVLLPLPAFQHLGPATSCATKDSMLAASSHAPSVPHRCAIIGAQRTCVRIFLLLFWVGP